MNEAQVLQMIMNVVIANGNNEITANVLRPVLIAMLQQPNDEIGDLNDLQTTAKTNLVDAINELAGSTSGGITILTGTADPNVIPPAAAVIGDFYIWNDGALKGFYQYNGSSWIRVVSSEGKLDRGGFTGTAQDIVDLTAKSLHDVLLNGNTTSDIDILLGMSKLIFGELGISSVRYDENDNLIIENQGGEIIIYDGVVIHSDQDKFFASRSKDGSKGFHLNNSLVDGWLEYYMPANSGTLSTTTDLANKVDKAPGKGLSDENYTLGEKQKLSALESSKWLGLYPTLTALETAHPTASAGNYADVDAGVGSDTIRYVWDVSDNKFVRSGSGTPLTPAQIKQMYESNSNTNVYDDVEKAKVAANTAKVTNATHTGEVTGSTTLTITNKAVTNAKLADMPTMTIKGKNTAGTGTPLDLSVSQVKAMLNQLELGETPATAYRGDRGKVAYDHSQAAHAPSDAQKNVNTDWDATSGDALLLNKPTRVNFNIYNQTKNNSVTVSNTVKTSVVSLTTGSKLIPTAAKDSSYIGKVFGRFSAGGTNRNITIGFKIGNREPTILVDNADAATVNFSIDYIINYTALRIPHISGVVFIGGKTFVIDLEPLVSSDDEFDIFATLTGGSLTINSSYLHRNHNS